MAFTAPISWTRSRRTARGGAMVSGDTAGVSALVESFDQALSPRRLSAAARKRKILTAAEEQFAATGFHATNSTALARAADVSEAILYAHFGTKEKLFQD